MNHSIRGPPWVMQGPLQISPSGQALREDPRGFSLPNSMTRISSHQLLAPHPPAPHTRAVKDSWCERQLQPPASATTVADARPSPHASWPSTHPSQLFKTAAKSWLLGQRSGYHICFIFAQAFSAGILENRAFLGCWVPCQQPRSRRHPLRALSSPQLSAVSSIS